MTVWTVVTRKNGRGQFRKTGFEGTWQEARDYADTIPFEFEAYFVETTATQVYVSDAMGRRGRYVKIAPTAEERAAAKAEDDRVRRVAQDLLESWTLDYVVRDAHALLGREGLTPYGAAVALARAGWDRPALARRHS